jgi:hypothetical protein
MLNVNPANRPTLQEILDKPFVKKNVVEYIRTALSATTASPGDIHEVNVDSLRA